MNYNYGRFLEEAVSSVFGQTYPNIECVVVDNASTDETPAVLERLTAAYPDLVVLRRSQNDGQTPASLEGLQESSGNYVIFLDADDYLLPKCVETHIFAHLSLRPHVGLSSGDMLQVKGRHVVVASGEESSRYIRGWRFRRRNIFRPYSATDEWPSPGIRSALPEKVHYIPPLKIGWFWSPTSGICYRRDALDLFVDNAKLATLRTGTDLYFAFGCSGLSGSILIDEPLFAYRIHGGNIFTAHAQLDRTLNFTIGGHGDSNIKARLYLIDHCVEKAGRFTPNFPLKLNLCALIVRLDCADVDRSLPSWARRSRAAQAIVRNFDSFSEAVGSGKARVTLALLSRSLRSPRRLLRTLPRPDAGNT